MNSIELTRALFDAGYMSKEASVSVLKERDKIVNEALFKEASTFFKRAGFFSSFGKAMKAGGKTPPKILKDGVTGGVGWSDVGANLTKILALAGLTSAGAAGISVIGNKVKDSKLQDEIEKSYIGMRKAFPRIKEMDQGGVRRMFEVLSRYAPSMAANPTVAGSFIVTQANRSIIDPSMIGTLAKAQETIDKVRGNHNKHGISGIGFSGATSLANSVMSGG